jgi:hypothetical protein
LFREPLEQLVQEVFLFKKINNSYHLPLNALSFIEKNFSNKALYFLINPLNEEVN